MYCFCVDFSERDVLFSRDKTRQNEKNKQINLGNYASSTNSTRNLSCDSLSCKHDIKTYGKARYWFSSRNCIFLHRNQQTCFQINTAKIATNNKINIMEKINSTGNCNEREVIYSVKWLYVLAMSRTCFRVNPHSILAWMSRNFLLQTDVKSEV